MKKINLAVIGSRTFKDRDRLFRILDANINIIDKIISGGARGADSLAHEWCKERGVPILIYYPKWHDENKIFNRGAGLKRNYYIISSADRVLCFWDMKSRGTSYSLNIAKELNKPVKLLKFTPETKGLDENSVDEGSIK